VPGIAADSFVDRDERDILELLEHVGRTARSLKPSRLANYPDLLALAVVEERATRENQSLSQAAASVILDAIDALVSRDEQLVARAAFAVDEQYEGKNVTARKVELSVGFGISADRYTDLRPGVFRQLANWIVVEDGRARKGGLSGEELTHLSLTAESAWQVFCYLLSLQSVYRDGLCTRFLARDLESYPFNKYAQILFLRLLQSVALLGIEQKWAELNSERLSRVAAEHIDRVFRLDLRFYDEDLSRLRHLQNKVPRTEYAPFEETLLASPGLLRMIEDIEERLLYLLPLGDGPATNYRDLPTSSIVAYLDSRALESLGRIVEDLHQYETAIDARMRADTTYIVLSLVSRMGGKYIVRDVDGKVSRSDSNVAKTIDLLASLMFEFIGANMKGRFIELACLLLLAKNAIDD
jgi:hypothetical protein